MKHWCAGILLWMVMAPAAVAGDGRVWRASKPVPNEFIVVLKDQTGSNIDHTVAALAAGHGGKVLAVLRNGVKAFGVRLPPQAAEALSHHPLVDHVEENGEIAGASEPSWSFRSMNAGLTALGKSLAPGPQANHCPWTGSYFLCEYGVDTTYWHLDRLDQRASVGAYRAYAFNRTGAGVRVYVLDTGVLGSHEQFEGQVMSGITYGDGRPANDPCGGFFDIYMPGHGTAVASVIAGKTNGIAKNATIIPVKVFNCDTTTGQAYSQILWWCWGLDYIIGNAVRPAVVNISGGYSVPANQGTLCDDPRTGERVNCISAFEYNVRELLVGGITVVTSANNQSNGNCDRTPARMGYGNPSYDYHVITVGGTTEQDQRWVRLPGEEIPDCTPQNNCDDTGSNYGYCVDVYAPAQHFYHLAHIASNTAYRTRIDQLSGTSFAAPIVTGAVARILEANPLWSPQQVWQYIESQATRTSVCYTPTPCNNRLVYMSPFN